MVVVKVCGEWCECVGDIEEEQDEIEERKSRKAKECLYVPLRRPTERPCKDYTDL